MWSSRLTSNWIHETMFAKKRLDKKKNISLLFVYNLALTLMPLSTSTIFEELLVLQMVPNSFNSVLALTMECGFASTWFCFKLALCIDAQSFSNSFEGVYGAVKKSGRGSSTFVFYCIFMLQFFKVFWGGTWGAPLLLPLPLPLCASMALCLIRFCLKPFYLSLF